MSRWIPALLLACLAPSFAQTQQPTAKQDPLKKERPKPATTGKEEVPPEEDKSLSVKEYSFNPLQAKHEIQTGDYYFKKHSYRAAAARYREATRWNEGDSEAWLLLGRAAEKLKDRDAAKEAYAKYLAAAPDAKDAAEIRKKLDKLK